MLTDWCILISDVDELHFFLIGPFDSKREAEEFEGDVGYCTMIMTIHPYIKAFNWLGRVRTPREERASLLKDMLFDGQTT